MLDLQPITYEEACMELADIKPGMTVFYIPPHAHGNIDHPDCEEGLVTSLRGAIVFVRFHGRTSQGCRAQDVLYGGGPYRSGSTLDDLHDRQEEDFQALLETETEQP